MLSGIIIDHFKGILKSEIDLKVITILIGPNGSGKSSIGQALLILNQSLDFFSSRGLLRNKNIKSSGRFLDLGNLDNLYYQKNEKNPIIISLKNKYEDLESIINFEIKNSKINLANITFKGLGSYNFLDSNNDLVNDITIKRGTRKSLSNENFSFSFSLRDSLQPINIGLSFKASKKTSNVEIQANEIIEELNKLVNLENILNKVFYVPALRGTDKPSHSLVDDSITHLSPPNLNYDKRNDSWLSKLLYEDELFNLVSAWCEELFKTKLKLDIKPGKKLLLSRSLSLSDSVEEIKVSLINEGFGLNQVAFLLSQLAIAPNGSLVIIEEPEIHLHPKAQSKLMEILINHALETDKKLLITTHSEHIIYYALTKIGLKEMNQDNLSLYYFQKENDFCSSSKIKFDKNGQLEEGLPGFFDANLERFQRYQKILMDK